MKIFTFLNQYSRFGCTRFVSWLRLSVAPYLHSSSERFFALITREPWSKYWSAIRPSQKWNLLIIRSLIGFTGITVVWASVTSVDESVQAIGIRTGWKLFL